MSRRSSFDAAPALVLPLLAVLALSSCDSGPRGTCSAFDFVSGNRIDVTNGSTISQDDCFSTCRTDEALVECQFTPSPNQAVALPFEPVV